MDDELGIRVLKIPGMKKAWKDAIKKLRRSKREKKTIERFGYDTYMSKVVQILIQTVLKKQKLRRNGWMQCKKRLMHWLKIKHGIR